MPKALGYWTIGTHYLHLAEAACEELVKKENAWVVVTPQIQGKPFSWEEHCEQTKWSDHSISIAVLFNFFHGIEVMLKGFISLSEEVPRHHRLTDLLSMFEEKFPDSALGPLVRQFTIDIQPESPLGQFFTTNKCSVDTWYQALKYPESTTGQAYSHYDLKYGGEGTIDFWKSINLGSRQLCREAVALSQTLEPPTAPIA